MKFQPIDVKAEIVEGELLCIACSQNEYDLCYEVSGFSDIEKTTIVKLSYETVQFIICKSCYEKAMKMFPFVLNETMDSSSFFNILRAGIKGELM